MDAARAQRVAASRGSPTVHPESPAVSGHRAGLIRVPPRIARGPDVRDGRGAGCCCGSLQGLRHGVVPAVALAAPAGLDVVRPAEASPRIAAVPHALVRVDERPARPPLLHGGEDRIEDQLPMHRGPCGPPNDVARGRIKHHGEVQPALPGADSGDVRRPRAVGPRHRELPCEPVRDQHGRLADDQSGRWSHS
jgi:hypothetical protein